MAKDYPENAADAKTSEVAFTVLDCPDAVLTKRYEISDGAPKAVGVVEMPTSGTARREVLRGTPTDILQRLAQSLDSMPGSGAIICAPPPDGRDEWRLTVKKSADRTAGTVARTKADFAPAAGPALLGLDFDVKDYPLETWAAIQERGGLDAILEEAFPGFANAACLRRPSSSSFIRLEGEAGDPKLCGEHRYYIIQDGTDAAAFAKRLAQRLKLCGWAWAKVSAAGTILQRNPLDAGASDPSRIFFEADAELGDGLEYGETRRSDVTCGGMLDTAALRELDAEETAEIAAIEDRAADAVRVEAERIWTTRQEGRVRKRVATGVPEAQARSAVSHYTDRQELLHFEEIHLDSGEVVTVDEILCDKNRYHRQKCAMPLEPDYGNGRNLAIIYTDGEPHIYAQGHGGVDFKLCANPTRFFDIEEPVGLPFEGGAADRDEPDDVFECLDLEAIEAMEPPEFLVDRHFPADGVGFIYGAPGSKKSFLALDMALHIAHGLPSWHGDTIKPRTGHVVYIAGEGASGLKHRVAAWKRGRFLPEGARAKFTLIRQSMNFMRPEDVQKLHRSIRKQAPNGVDLVIVDTVSQMLPGADENLQKDMTLYMQACKALRDTHSCCVVGVHHSSKAKSGGDAGGDMRGSSVFRGGADFIFRTEDTKPHVVFHCQKMKDAEDGWKDSYILPKRQWVDTEGVERSSLVPKRVSEAVAEAADECRRRQIAEIIAAVLDGRESALWPDIKEDIASYANKDGPIRPQQKIDNVRDQVVNALGSSPVRIERVGGDVLVSCSKTGTAKNSTYRFTVQNVRDGVFA